jgi:hypothetical protein
MEKGTEFVYRTVLYAEAPIVVEGTEIRQADFGGTKDIRHFQSAFGEQYSEIAS